MDPNQSNDGSQGGFLLATCFPSRVAGTHTCMATQAPPSRGLQPPAPNVSSMMHPVAQLPESADVSVDVEEATGSPTLPGKVKRSKVVGRIKLANFNPDEDINLVKSWLKIRCDPITCTGPKRDRMWDRILQRYNMGRGSYPDRSVKSLQSRWDTIKAEVGKFSSFYADVLRENPSGMSDADKTTHAAANFAGVLKHNVAYMHCWEIMRDEPKWQDPKAGASAKSAAGEGFGEDAINLADDNSSPTSSAAKRPMGRDAAKAAKKKANSSPGSTSWGLQPAAPNVSSMIHPVAHLPESADVSVDMEEATGSPTLSGKVKRSKVVGRIKLANFKPDEDVNLVKSWLKICCDPITITGQKRDRMWDRILQRYNMRRGSYPERSVRSLQSRWDNIKAEVGKFSSFYADVLRENPSGMSDADKTTHAAANFAGVLKHYFAYMHCWEIMKDEPKWQDPKARASAKSAAGEGFGEDAVNLADDNSSPTSSAVKRPMGRDAAKAAKMKANSSPGSTSSSEYASTMKELSSQKLSIMQEEVLRKNDHFQQLASIDEKRFEDMRSHNQLLLSIEQEKIRIMREKHDMERQVKERQEDERILAIDLDGCTPAQRVYYQALQEEIFEKIAARRGKRQGP